MAFNPAFSLDCSSLCYSFNAGDSCYADCGCDALAQVAVAEPLREEYWSLLKSKNCEYVYINACEYAADYDQCLKDAGCSQISSLEWLVTNVPAYLWKSVQPYSLKYQSGINSRINAVDDCSSCENYVGDRYWDCIDKYCNRLGPLQLLNQVTPGLFVENIKKDTLKSCECYDQCAGREDYYACIDSCEYVSCDRKEIESFVQLKKFFNSVIGLQNNKNDKIMPASFSVQLETQSSLPLDKNTAQALEFSIFIPVLLILLLTAIGVALKNQMRRESTSEVPYKLLI